jgi:uncharacterized phage protein (TIGR02218 family)
VTVAARGQQTFHGSRDILLNSQNRSGVLSAFFAVVGNADFLFADDQVYSFTEDQARATGQHTMNFDGELSKFSVKTNGNNYPATVVYRVQKNSEDTLQLVAMEWELSGKIESDSPAIVFETDDILIGYASAAEIGDTAANVGFLQCQTEMRAERGTATVYRTGGDGAYYAFGGRIGNGFGTIPLSGTNNHFNTLVSWTNEAYGYDESRGTMEMRNTVAGTYSYFQACGEVVSASNLILRMTNDGDPGLNDEAEVFLVLFSELTAYYIQTEGEFKVRRNGRVSIAAGEQISGSTGGAYLWSTGVNFVSASAGSGVDVMLTEGWDISGNHYEPSTRALQFDYHDPTIPREGPNAVSFPTHWMASLIGTYYPKLVPWDMPECPGADPFEYKSLFQRVYEMEPTFEMGIRNLRVCCDLNTSGTKVKVAVSRSGALPGREGVFVVCGAAGWYTNNVDEIVVGPDDPAAAQEFRQGASLAFSPGIYRITNEGDQNERQELARAAIAHISTIQFTYGSHTSDRGGEADCFHREIPEPVQVEPLPAITRLARSIKIVRADGVIRCYTEHDEDIEHDGDTYKAIGGGFFGSANELGATLGDVGNIEAQGYTAGGEIEIDDLFGGRFDTAQAEVWLLPWGPDNDQPARRIGGGVVGRTRQADNSFSVEVLSWSTFLSRRSLLDVVTPDCPYDLGSSRCGVDLPARTVTGFVTNATDDETSLGVRRKFTDLGRTEAAGVFTDGIVTFTSGANAGQARKIKEHLGGGQFVLWDALVYPVLVGDEYSMSPGCDKRLDTCREKFDNLLNFGGFPTVPGGDAAGETPSGKMGQ